VDHDEVGNSYNRHIIGDRLRGEQGYDGVVCTDWGITGDEGPNVETFSGKCWGVETLTVAQRHYRILMAGVDQFGGNNDMGPVLEA
jgi:beta-glucosidase